MTSPSLYILDTSILIDLDNGGLMERFMLMAPHTALPDLVLAEFVPGAKNVQGLSQVEVVEFDAVQLGQIVSLRARYGGLSIVDSAALFLAHERQAVLLTGDAPLRRAADLERVPVHGALWILDELLGAALLDMACACAALQMMLVAGARLPARDCELRFLNWGCVGQS